MSLLAALAFMALGSSPSSATPAEADEPGLPATALSLESSRDSSLLALKRRQLRGLRRLLAQERGQALLVRAARLHQLCLLERELGILANHRASLVAAATSCRRVLALRSPGYLRLDEARLTLAGLELRLGHPRRARDLVADVLARRRGVKRLRCAALALRGILTKTEAAQRAVITASACAGPSGRAYRIQARYRLAWSLVRGRRAIAGQRELKRLLALERPTARFVARVLRDLSAIWGAHGPPAGALRLLVRRAKPKLAARLATRVATGLIGQRRLPALLRFCKVRRGVPGPVSNALAWARLRGLGELGSGDQLLAEVRRWRRTADKRLRIARAAALLRGAIRLARPDQGASAEEPQAAHAAATLRRHREQQSAALFREVARRFPRTPQASQAEVRLAGVAQHAGRFEAAAAHLRRALVSAPSSARPEIAYRQLALLQRSLETTRSKHPRARAATRWLRAAESFLAGYPRHLRAAAVRLARLDLLALTGAERRRLEAAQAFIATHPRHAELSRARAHAFAAARALRRFPLAHRLAKQAAGLGEAPAVVARWRALAAEAALAEARRRAASNEPDALSGARRWVVAATATAHGATLRRARLLEAMLAGRAADAPRLAALGRSLLRETKTAADRLRLSRLLASWHRALGGLPEAARLELSELKLETRAEARVGRQLAAARDLVDAGLAAQAAPILRRLRRDLLADPAPSAALGRAMLALAALLERTHPRRAYGFYLQRANTLWRTRRRLAAELLLGAVRLSPSPRRAAQLSKQAIGLTLRLRRDGAVDPLAARARLVLVQTWRRRGWARWPASPHGRPPAIALGVAQRRLAELSALYAPLLRLLALRDARWSSAAGVGIGWVLGQMASQLEAVAADPRLRRALRPRIAALRQRRTRVLASLAALAKDPSTLNRHTLAAARASWPVARFTAQVDALPPARPDTAALRALLERGKDRVASRVADAALRLHGSRPDLLCLRAVARLRRGEVEAAISDLAQARRLPRRGSRALPGEAAVRLNWAALALWRGAATEARRELAALGGAGPSVSQVTRAKALARRSAATRQRGGQR